MMTLIYAALLPLFVIVIMIPATIQARKHRARLLDDRLRRDRRRFLKMGALRKLRQQEELESLGMKSLSRERN